MKYLQIIRKVHLWIGLVLTVFLLAEAVTGLILSEPALIGATQSSHAQHITQSAHEGEGKVTPSAPYNAKMAEEHAKAMSGDVSTLVFIKELHQGILSNRNFRWLVDIVALGIIVLTISGVYLSIPLLKAQFKSKA